jgi:hypothetical protein
MAESENGSIMLSSRPTSRTLLLRVVKGLHVHCVILEATVAIQIVFGPLVLVFEN